MLTLKPSIADNPTKLVTKKKIQHYTYALEDVIGKGFSSHVYKGKNQMTGERVAVKVIQMDMIRNDVYKDLLASEIYCLKLLRNASNIIQLKDVFTTRNNTYVICELCQLGTLSQILSKRILSEAEAVRFMEQLMRGYLHLHKLGIIHRDIKPANIFAQRDQLKIADFGFATFCSQKRIREKYNIGSPLYMPPQSLVNNQYSFESDIWSLGVVFYQMIFGKAPWGANSEAELLNKILQTPILNLIPKGSLSSTSIQFLRRTLDPDPRTRMTPQQLQQFLFNNKSKMSGSIVPIIPTPKARVVSLTKQDQGLISTNGTSGSTQSLDFNDITKQLLSQIHMCRFIYQLLKKILESGIQMKDFQGLVSSLRNFLGAKLFEIGQTQYANPFNILRISEYRKTEDFIKLMTLIRNYRSRYEGELGRLEDNLTSGNGSFVMGLLSQIIRNLSLAFSKVTPQNIRSYQPSVILLDHLTTAYMLVKLNCKSDLASFAVKSKIEQIVDSATSSVSYDHFVAIQNKISALGLI